MEPASFFFGMGKLSAVSGLSREAQTEVSAAGSRVDARCPAGLTCGCAAVRARDLRLHSDGQPRRPAGHLLGAVGFGRLGHRCGGDRCIRAGRDARGRQPRAGAALDGAPPLGARGRASRTPGSPLGVADRSPAARFRVRGGRGGRPRGGCARPARGAARRGERQRGHGRAPGLQDAGLVRTGARASLPVPRVPSAHCRLPSRQLSLGSSATDGVRDLLLMARLDLAAARGCDQRSGASDASSGTATQVIEFSRESLAAAVRECEKIQQVRPSARGASGRGGEESAHRCIGRRQALDELEA